MPRFWMDAHEPSPDIQTGGILYLSVPKESHIGGPSANVKISDATAELL